MFEIENPKRVGVGSFFGTFTAHDTTSGQLIRDIKLFEKGGSRWINFPSKEYTNKEGQTKYWELVTYDSLEKIKSVKAEILEAVEKYMESNPRFDSDKPKTRNDVAPF